MPPNGTHSAKPCSAKDETVRVLQTQRHKTLPSLNSLVRVVLEALLIRAVLEARLESPWLAASYRRWLAATNATEPAPHAHTAHYVPLSCWLLRPQTNPSHPQPNTHPTLTIEQVARAQGRSLKGLGAITISRSVPFHS